MPACMNGFKSIKEWVVSTFATYSSLHIFIKYLAHFVTGTETNRLGVILRIDLFTL